MIDRKFNIDFITAAGKLLSSGLFLLSSLLILGLGRLSRPWTLTYLKLIISERLGEKFQKRRDSYDFFYVKNPDLC